MLAALAIATRLLAADTLPPIEVTVDSNRKEVVILAGPFDLPDMSGMTDHSESHDTPVLKFDWPIDGWFRGFEMSVVDPAGGKLPRRLLHHLIMINFDRRQLVYRAAERLWGAGIETGSVEVPKTVGIPLSRGTNLGMYIAWHNATGKDVSGARLRIVMKWMPRNQMPQPVNVLPFYADVNLRVGGANEFDVPPGPSDKAFEFTVPASGRLLALGGHMHDYGRELRLEDAESGKVLTRVKAISDSAGRLVKIERKLFGVSGAGLKLRAGHRYRVVAHYDNPTADTLVKGAMASIIGLIAPDDMHRWPAVEPDDSLYKRDLRFLARRGYTSMKPTRSTAPGAATMSDSAMAGHEAHQHNH
jgi:hypothetical protein